MELTTKLFTIYEYSSGHYRVVVLDKNLARRVNRVLEQYEDYSFRDGDEPVFKFEEHNKREVLEALKVSQ